MALYSFCSLRMTVAQEQVGNCYLLCLYDDQVSCVSVCMPGWWKFKGQKDWAGS